MKAKALKREEETRTFANRLAKVFVPLCDLVAILVVFPIPLAFVDHIEVVARYFYCPVARTCDAECKLDRTVLARG